MGLVFTLRPATLADLAACAALVASADPQEWVDFEYDTLAAVQAFDASLAAAGALVVRIVAEQDGVIIGVGAYFWVPWTAREHHYLATVRVAHAARNQGVGHALWNRIRESVRTCAGRSLAIEVRANATATLATCTRAGLREAFRSLEYLADPRGFEPAPFNYAIEKAGSHGIRVLSLPELQQNDLNWLAKLHSLYITLSRDVPIPERATISPAGLAEFVGGMDSSLPDACFVAVDSYGNYAGLSFMHCLPGEPILIQKLTGVREAYRGQSIALALKIYTMIYAREHGYHTISTWIETNNAAMKALATRLGFVEQAGGVVVLEDDLMNA